MYMQQQQHRQRNWQQQKCVANEQMQKVTTSIDFSKDAMAQMNLLQLGRHKLKRLNQQCEKLQRTNKTLDAQLQLRAQESTHLEQTLSIMKKGGADYNHEYNKAKKNAIELQKEIQLAISSAQEGKHFVVLMLAILRAFMNTCTHALYCVSIIAWKVKP